MTSSGDMYLPWNTSRNRLREAEAARRNRQEIVRAWSTGQISRRDLVKLGLVAAGGALVGRNGLSPFAPSAYAAVPTGTPPSPIPPGIEFTQPMPRLYDFQRKPLAEVFRINEHPAPGQNMAVLVSLKLIICIRCREDNIRGAHIERLGVAD